MRSEHVLLFIWLMNLGSVQLMYLPSISKKSKEISVQFHTTVEPKKARFTILVLFLSNNSNQKTSKDLYE